MQGGGVVNSRRDDDVDKYDLRGTSRTPVLFVEHPAVVANLGGWMMECQARTSDRYRMLCICITAPSGAITDMATDIPAGSKNCRSAVSAQLSPDVGLIFRVQRTPAQDARCVAALSRVVAAVRALPSTASRDEARLLVECAAHNIAPERVRTFRESFVKAVLEDRPGCAHLPTRLVVAFLASGWTPRNAATLNLNGSWVMDRVTPTWIRRIATSAAGATRMLNWASGETFVRFQPAEISLARRYQKAGWTYGQAREVARLTLPGQWDDALVGGWHHMPAGLALCAARAGIEATEARSLFERGELTEDNAAVLAALRKK